MRTQSVNVLEIPYYRLNMQEPAKTSATLHLRMGILPVSSYMYTLSNRYNIVFIHAYKVSPNTFLTTQTIVTRETNHKRRILLKYTDYRMRPQTDVTPAISLREKVAVCDCAIARCDFVA